MFKCEHRDCEGKEREFKTLKGLHIHQKLEHEGMKQGPSKITNTKCLMPECNGRVFSTERAFSIHLRKMHSNISKEEYAKHFRTNEWTFCPVCGNEYYRPVCAQEGNKKPTCGNKKCLNEFMNQARRATCLERYNVEHQWKVPKIHDKCHSEEAWNKRKETWLDHFGFDSPLKNPEWHCDGREQGYKHTQETKSKISEKVIEKREQILETIAKKPGGRRTIIEKGRKTLKEKTGYDHNFANPKLVEKWHKEYEAGYYWPTQNPEIKEKILNNDNYINRKGKYKKGWFKSTKTGAWEFFESSYEYIRFLQLDEDSNVIFWHKNRTQTIKYQRYEVKTDSFHEADCIPDIFILDVDGKLYIEELKGTEISVNSWLKADAIKDFCEKNNMIFKYKMYEDIMTNDYWVRIHKEFIKNYKRADWSKKNDE